MILAIDIGNSNITVGLLEQNQVCLMERLSTNHNQTDLEYAISIRNILEIHHITRDAIHGAILVSVVPPVSGAVRRATEKLLGMPVLQVHPGMHTGLTLSVDNPTTLGCDRVVDAVAALHEYHDGMPLMVIDMGTATTSSVINDDGVFLGGIICPGVKVSLESLTRGTSQLPGIDLEAPHHAIGTNTVDSMKSGMILGTAAAIDGLVSRVERELGCAVKAIATGGLARVILPHCKREIIYDETLLLKGLWYLYDMNREAVTNLPGKEI